MADPILTVDGVYGPGEMQTPEQLPAYIPATPAPQIDFESYRNGLSGGAYGGQQDYESSIRKALAGVPVNREQTRAFTPIAFNAKESGFDPIYNSFKDNLYRTEGFIPYRDNEDLYARELGKSGQLWQGLKGILPLAAVAHNEAWKSEADMWSGLVTGDFKKAFSLTMDADDMLKLNKLTNDINNSNFVPLTQEQREGSFNMGKFARGIQQFGFTLGTTAQFLEQTGLELAAAAVTAPGTGLGSILAEIGNLTRRAVTAARTLDKFYDMNKAFKNIMKFENTFMDANKISKMYNTMNDLRKASPIGSFGNFYRFTKEYNFAASEARFERAQSYAEFIESKERDFLLTNGRPMTDEERSAVEKQAMDISNANGVTNIALLMAMNRLNMGNVMRTGFGLSKAIAAETGTIADDIIMRSAKPFSIGSYFKKKATKETEKAATAAADGPFMKASDVKMFSSEWLRGKGNSSFRWGANSAWEGVQEVAQSTSADYWRNYYSEKATLSEEARNDWGHLMGLSRKSLGKALGAQNSREGLDTFISGFIIGIPSVAMNKAIGFGQRKLFSKEYADKERRIQETVDSLNKWANSPLQVFDRKLEGYVNQTEIAEGLRRAAKQNNPYAFKNLERKAFQEFALTAHRAGKLDAVLDMMEQASADLTDEQFKETYGIESDSLNRKTARDYITSLRGKAEEFVKTYDDVTRRMPNPVNYKQFKEGTFERLEAERKHIAWNKTLEDYIFQRDSQQDVVTRYKDILGKNQQNLGSQAYEAFYRMTNPEFVDMELGVLRDQIRVMNSVETLTPEQRELMKDYKKKQDLLTKWKAELSTIVKPGEITAPATPSKTFTDYLNIHQKAAGMPELEADKLRDAFNDLGDLYRLSEDQRVIVKNLNFLADPDNFNDLFDMHNTMLSDEYKKIIALREEKSANYDKILPLVMRDADFRAKHYEMVEQLEQALAEGNNNLVYDILDKIYEAEFGEPVVGTDQSVEEPVSNTEQPPAAPPVNNTPGTKGSMRLEGKKLIIEGVGEIDFTGNTKDTDFATMMPEVTQILKNWDAQWVNDNLVNFNGQFIFNYNGRVMVLVRAGNFIVPYYFSSSGTSGKKIDWHYIFGIDSKTDWIIKGAVNDQGEVEYSKQLAARYPNAIKRLEKLKDEIRQKLPLNDTSKINVGKLIFQNRKKYGKSLMDIYKGLDVVDNVGPDGVETNENYTYLINATLGVIGLDIATQPTATVTDIERQPVIGDTLTSDSNQNYKIRGFTDKGGIQWENTKDGSKGVWNKEKFDGYIKDGTLKYDIAQPTAASGSTAKGSTQKTSSMFTDLKEQVSKADTLDKLKDLLKKINDALTAKNGIEVEEYDELIDELQKKRVEIVNKSKGPKTIYISDTSAEFISEFNELVDKLEQTLAKPDVSIDEVKAAFRTMNPILLKLDPKVRTKYEKPLKERLSAITDEIQKRDAAKDTKGLIDFITATFKTPNRSISEAVNEIFEVLDLVIDPSQKDTVIAHFEQEFERAVDAQVAAMSRAMSGKTASNPLAVAMINQRNKFVLSVQSGLDRLKKQSEDLSVKKGSLVFTVSVSDNYSTKLNTDIQAFKFNSDSTEGQREAIGNLLVAGVLGEEDLSRFDQGTIKGASELVSLGVSRIFALQINKAAEAFTKDKAALTDLKNVLKDYFASRIDDPALIEKRKKFVDQVFDEDLDSSNSVEEILSVFGVNKTQTVSDEQYKLLDVYRKAVNRVMDDSNLLAAFNKIENRKQQMIAEGTKNIAEYLNDDVIKLFRSSLANKSAGPLFQNDLINAYDKVSRAKTHTEIMGITMDLAERHMKKWKADDMSELINALYVGATEIMNAADPETPGVELTESEMLDMINGVSSKKLTTGQLQQFKEFSKVYLDQLKSKLKAASGYVPGKLELGQGKLSGPIQLGTLKFLSLRPKMSSDIRTVQDLMNEYEIKDNKMSVKTALSKISKSKFATDTEQYLAGSMLPLFDENVQIIIDNTIDSVGEYDSETGEIRINLDAIGYSEENPSSPLETVILHELIHSKVEEAIADEKSEYGRSIRSVFNAVKSSENGKNFYAFSDELQPDEQLREFVTEAFTNPAFQYMLAKTPYANSKKTTWQAFLEIIKKILEKLGVTTEDNALNEVLNLTSEILNASAGTMLERIGQATSVSELASIRAEFRALRRKFKIDDEEYNTLSAAVTANSRQFRVKELNEKLKGSMKVMVDNKTYHFVVSQNKRYTAFEIYTIGPKGPRRVRAANRLQPVLTQLAKKAGYAALIDEGTASYIKDLMGDPQAPGSYASGQTLSDEPEGFTQFPEMYIEPDEEDFGNPIAYRQPSLRFKSKEEFERFERKWINALREKRKSKIRFNQLVKELENEFGATAVAGYGELYNTIGSVDDIRKLIRRNAVSVDSRAGEGIMDMIYSTNNAVLDILQWANNGGELFKTETEAKRQKINSALSYYFGFQVPDDLQNTIENDLLKDPQPPPPGGDPTLTITTIKSKEEYSEDLTRLDYTRADHPVFDRSATNINPLRSTANDLFYDKDSGAPIESNAYREYYSNVREVINNLHLKPDSYFTDLRVTLDKNNSNLRWDGSANNEYYDESDNPVIGYISDNSGNPIVFDRKGNIVGTLDKNNLDERKGLDNGENQIVYFHLPKQQNKDKFDENLWAFYEKAFAQVAQGKPQIARISRITAGVMNFKDMAIPTTKTSKNTAKNPEFKEQLLKDNVEFSINRINGSFNVIITAPDGSKNTRGLFPTDTRGIAVDTGNGPIQLSRHVFQVMQTYLEMKASGKFMSELGNIENDLVPFVYNIWLTGNNHKLKIPQNFSNIRIKVPDMDLTNEVRKTNPKAPIQYKDQVYRVFDTNQATGEVTVNTENLNKVVNYINRMPVNIWSQWLDGSKPFRFPVIVQENGEKSIKFVEKNYLQFLMDEVGLKAYFLEIPEGADIKRYNSIVEYTIPTDLTPSTVSLVSQQDIINNADAVQKKADDNISAAQGNNVVRDAPKRTRFRAPKLQNIYEKTCK